MCVYVLPWDWSPRPNGIAGQTAVLYGCSRSDCVDTLLVGWGGLFRKRAANTLSVGVEGQNGVQMADIGWPATVGYSCLVPACWVAWCWVHGDAVSRIWMCPVLGQRNRLAQLGQC